MCAIFLQRWVTSLGVGGGIVDLEQCRFGSAASICRTSGQISKMSRPVTNEARLQGRVVASQQCRFHRSFPRPRPSVQITYPTLNAYKGAATPSPAETGLFLVNGAIMTSSLSRTWCSEKYFEHYVVQVASPASGNAIEVLFR